MQQWLELAYAVLPCAQSKSFCDFRVYFIGIWVFQDDLVPAGPEAYALVLYL